MSTITVRRNISKDKAAFTPKKIETIIRGIAKRYSQTESLTCSWDAAKKKMAIKGKRLSGQLTRHADAVEITVTLSPLLSIFKDRIKNRIEKELEALV